MMRRSNKEHTVLYRKQCVSFMQWWCNGSRRWIAPAQRRASLGRVRSNLWMCADVLLQDLEHCSCAQSAMQVGAIVHKTLETVLLLDAVARMVTGCGDVCAKITGKGLRQVHLVISRDALVQWGTCNTRPGRKSTRNHIVHSFFLVHTAYRVRVSLSSSTFATTVWEIGLMKYLVVTPINYLVWVNHVKRSVHVFEYNMRIVLFSSWAKS